MVSYNRSILILRNHLKHVGLFGLFKRLNLCVVQGTLKRPDEHLTDDGLEELADIPGVCADLVAIFSNSSQEI